MYAIVDQGLDDVRMRDIARRAGMSPGHILYYFASKDALLLEVLRWSEEDLAARRREILAKTRTRDRAIQRFCECYLPEDSGMLDGTYGSRCMRDRLVTRRPAKCSSG